MPVERFTQLKFDEVLDNLDVTDEDPQEISQAAKERFEEMVAQALAITGPTEGGHTEGGHIGPPLQDNDQKPEWFAQYMELAKMGFAWRVAAYIAWASSPKIGRWPKTQAQFAREVLGLTSDRVIIAWRQKNPSIDSTIGQMQSQPLFEHRADFFNALIVSGTTPDYKNHQDRKLALEILGDYNPKIKIEDGRKGSGSNDMAELSDLELEALGNARLKELRAEKEGIAGKVTGDEDAD